MDTARDDVTLPLKPLAVLLLLCGCAAQSSPRPGPDPAPKQVRVAEAQRSRRAVVTEGVGNVRAARTATIAPLLCSTVAEMRVGLGSPVRAGDVLVRLGAREVEARLEQSQA